MSSSATWLSDEPKLGLSAWQRVRRRLLRARRRPVVTLGLTLTLAGAIFAAQAWRTPMYKARVDVLLTEGIPSSDGRSLQAELRASVDRAMLAPSTLKALVLKHDLMSKLDSTTPDEAVARMRELTDVRVRLDDAEATEGQLAHTRLAHATIAFSAGKPSLALAVAQELGELVANSHTAPDPAAAVAHLEELRARAQSAASKVARQREQVESKIAAAEAVTDLIEAQLQHREASDPSGLVQVLNTGAPGWLTATRARRWVCQGALSLGLGAFFAVILAGALGRRVWDAQDLVRAGLRPLGKVPISAGRASRRDVRLRRAVARRAFDV